MSLFNILTGIRSGSEMLFVALATTSASMMMDDLPTLDKIKMEKQRDFTEDDWKHRPKSETACVFLKDNACSIYDVRPATCRACVYTGDPEHCLPSVGKSSIIMEAEVVASATNNISEPDLIPVKILKRLMSKSEYL